MSTCKNSILGHRHFLRHCRRRCGQAPGLRAPGRPARVRALRIPVRGAGRGVRGRLREDGASGRGRKCVRILQGQPARRKSPGRRDPMYLPTYIPT
jgi:hypothetical protein